nr:hypothetical protein [Tanacetum cinerariifolium]
MPIPNKLITADIQGEPYYKEYLEKVAKHQRYLANEKESDPDSPAPKHAKATKKSNPSAPKADLRPPVTKPASSQQLEPKPAPAKSQGKKCKSVTETSNKPSLARRSKPGLGLVQPGLHLVHQGLVQPGLHLELPHQSLAHPHQIPPYYLSTQVQLIMKKIIMTRGFSWCGGAHLKDKLINRALLLWFLKSE